MGAIDHDSLPTDHILIGLKIYRKISCWLLVLQWSEGFHQVANLSVTALASMIQSLSFPGSNPVSPWKLEARRVERLQQVVRGRPAEPEGAVRPEEALPEGGGGPALSLPGEHAHSGSSLQQPCLPSGMEPWALVSGKWELLEPWVMFPMEKEGDKNTCGVSASPPEDLSCLHLHGITPSQCEWAF